MSYRSVYRASTSSHRTSSVAVHTVLLGQNNSNYHCPESSTFCNQKVKGQLTWGLWGGDCIAAALSSLEAVWSCVDENYNLLPNNMYVVVQFLTLSSLCSRLISASLSLSCCWTRALLASISAYNMQQYDTSVQNSSLLHTCVQNSPAVVEVEIVLQPAVHLFGSIHKNNSSNP